MDVNLLDESSPLPAMFVAARRIKTKEPSSVAAEDVALLLRVQERRLLHNRDGRFDNAWPIHLVRSEHDPLAEPGINKLLELLVEVCPRIVPLDPANVDIELGVGS